MKRMLAVALLAMTVPCFLAAEDAEKASKSTGAEAQEVKKIITQIREAQLKGDAAVLERSLADDYVFTNPFGEVMTKDQAVSDLKSGALKFRNMKTENLQLRIYGDTAVATGESTLEGERRGQDISGHYRLTWVLVKNQGRWQPVAAQSTRVSDGAMAASDKSKSKGTSKTED